MTELTYEANPNAAVGQLGKGGGDKGGWPEGMDDYKIRFIRLDHGGQGWDDGMHQTGADINFLRHFSGVTGFKKIARKGESHGIAMLAKYPKDGFPPFVYMTGNHNMGRVGSREIKALREYTKLPFDVHLMISPVHKYIKDFANAGSDIITIHPEATENLEKSIFHIKELNKKVGVSLNPDTKINVIESHLNNIDLVLIMSVFPGFGGQKFIPETIKKIKDLKEIKDKNNYNFDIEVDGGVNFLNSKDIINAGANILVSGTTIFKENNGDIKKNIETLKSV